MFDAVTVLMVAGTFFLAGAVKGVIGLGLPTVSLAILTITIGMHEGMSLLLVPSLATNLWQAARGGHGRAILRRLWPFLVMATATILLGATALTRVDAPLLSALLGVLLVVYATVSLIGYGFTLTPRREVWAGPLAGAVNGVLTGMTGTFVVPGVMYLQAVGMPRDMLIQAMGMLFLASTTAIAVALHWHGLLTVERGALSTVALVPALVGMVLGQQIRREIPEPLFRRYFFAALLILGAYIVVRAMGDIA